MVTLRASSGTQEHVVEISAQFQTETPPLAKIFLMGPENLARNLQNIPESRYWGKPR